MMSQQNKLWQRFLSKPTDFTFNEMKRLLAASGYREIRTGRTAGSRVAFFNKASGHIIRLHKPHPRSVLKRYQLDFLEEELRAKGILK
jgi:hypothetical protein